ncbi:hypothetical protein, partial [Actinobacillus pleuropneumoniae]
LGISTGSLLTSTGCAMVGVLGDGVVEEWYGWMGKVKVEFVVAQGQRYEMRKEWVQLVGE